jgi:hypothetical protein
MNLVLIQIIDLIGQIKLILVLKIKEDFIQIGQVHFISIVNISDQVYV